MHDLLNNLDPEVLEFIAGFAIVLNGIFVTIIGFFLRSQFRILATVRDTVEDLKTVVAVIKADQRLVTHEKRINAQEEKLDEHAERLAVVETKVAGAKQFHQGT